MSKEGRAFGVFSALMLLAITLATMPAAFAGTSGPSPVPNPPNFYIATTAVRLCKGMINYVPVTVTNKGSAISQDAVMTALQLSVGNSGSVHQIANGTVDVDSVAVNQSVTTHIPVFVSYNASPIVSLSVSLSYYYYFLYSDSETRNLSFGTATCASPLNLTVSPAVLTSGVLQNMSVTLRNAGMAQLNNISLSVSLPHGDGAVLTPQPLQVSSMPAHAAMRLNESIFVYTNASQSFPLNITGSMYNGTSLMQVSDSIPVLATGTANLTASDIALAPQIPVAGSIFSISFVLTNIGTSAAQAVTLRPKYSGNFTAVGAGSVFVGDIEPDTQTPVTLTFTAAKSLKAGTYTMPIDINYLNSLRQNKSVELSMRISIAAQGGAANYSPAAAGARRATADRGSAIPLYLVSIVVAVIALALLALHVSRRRSSKRHK